MIYLIHKTMGNMQQDLSGALHDSLLCYEHLQILRNYPLLSSNLGPWRPTEKNHFAINQLTKGKDPIPHIYVFLKHTYNPKIIWIILWHSPYNRIWQRWQIVTISFCTINHIFTFSPEENTAFSLRNAIHSSPFFRFFSFSIQQFPFWFRSDITLGVFYCSCLQIS